MTTLTEWILFFAFAIIVRIAVTISGFLSPPAQPNLVPDPRVARDQRIRELEEELGIS